MNKSSMISVEEASKRLFSHARQTETEIVPLEKAANRILAKDLSAKRAQPPFAASAMDGYAVRARDLTAAPVELSVIGEAPAGKAFEGSIRKSQTVRIFTGAPVPEGADAILIQENAEVIGNKDKILAREVVQSGRYIRPQGLDFAKDDILLTAPRKLKSADLALAAVMNHAQVCVFKKPRVGILATGDELVLPGTQPGPDQIISSNHIGIAANVEEAGGEAIQLGIARDTLESLQASLDQCDQLQCDILVTLGGASVGDHDLVKPVLEANGATLEFAKIAMRPGKPVNFGVMPKGNSPAQRLVLGLPGNPVSSMVGSRLFLMPLIRAFTGLPVQTREFVSAILGADLPDNDEREDYLRATLKQLSDGSFIATPFPRQDSSMLATFAKSDALIKRKPFQPASKSGDHCELIIL